MSTVIRLGSTAGEDVEITPQKYKLNSSEVLPGVTQAV